MPDVASSAFGAADRFARGRGRLRGAGLTKQGTSFSQSLNSNRNGLPVFGRGRGDPTHEFPPIWTKRERDGLVVFGEHDRHNPGGDVRVGWILGAPLE